MAQKKILNLTVLMFFTLCACIAQSGGADEKKPCNVTFSTLEGLPEMVLVGTDVVNIESLNPSSQTLESNYSVEIGGATLAIQVSQAKTVKTIRRTYQEPGTGKQVHEYSPVCTAKGLFSAEDLKGKIVEGGLLLLEEKPGVEGFPSDLWIYYEAAK
jgi:hypothetical protein